METTPRLYWPDYSQKSSEDKTYWTATNGYYGAWFEATAQARKLILRKNTLRKTLCEKKIAEGKSLSHISLLACFSNPPRPPIHGSLKSLSVAGRPPAESLLLHTTGWNLGLPHHCARREVCERFAMLKTTRCHSLTSEAAVRHVCIGVYSHADWHHLLGSCFCGGCSCGSVSFRPSTVAANTPAKVIVKSRSLSLIFERSAGKMDEMEVREVRTPSHAARTLYMYLLRLCIPADKQLCVGRHGLSSMRACGE